MAQTSTRVARRTMAGRMAILRVWCVLLSLEPHVLVRRRERVAGDQPEPRLLDPRSVAAHQSDLPDGRDHRLVVDELLDLVQRGLAPLLVELGGLLAEEPVDVRI